MLGIRFCLLAFVAVSNGDRASKETQCYDCHYDPDNDKHGGSYWGQFPGFPKCAMHDSVEKDQVVKWNCKTGKCFIRQDPNGLLYRGCADPANLPWGVDTTRNCQYQGQIPSLWYFCDGELCNGGKFGSYGVCSGDNEGLDEFYVETVETVHGARNGPDVGSDYGKDDNKYEYPVSYEKEESMSQGYDENYEESKYALPFEPEVPYNEFPVVPERPSGIDFEFYSEQYMNENNVPVPYDDNEYVDGNKKQDTYDDHKKSGQPTNKYSSLSKGKTSVQKSYNKKSDVVEVPHKKSEYQPPPSKKQNYQKPLPPMRKSPSPVKKSQPPPTKNSQPPPSKKSQPPSKKSPQPNRKSHPPPSKKSQLPPSGKSQPPPSKKSQPPPSRKTKSGSNKYQPMPYTKVQPQMKQSNYQPPKLSHKKSFQPPKQYQPQTKKSFKSKSSSSSSESEEYHKTANYNYKTEQASGKYPQPSYKSPKKNHQKSQKADYKTELPGPDYANGGIFIDGYQGNEFGGINEPYPLDKYVSDDEYYQQQPMEPYLMEAGVEKSGYEDDYSEHNFGINDKFMGSPDPVFKPDPYYHEETSIYGKDETDPYEPGYPEEPHQNIYEGIIANEKKLSYVAKTMLSAMADSFDFVDRYESESDYNPCDGRCHNNPSGLFSDPSDIERFIQCGDGMEFGKSCRCCKPYFLKCPYGTIFDSYTRVCTSTSGSTY